MRIIFVCILSLLSLVSFAQKDICINTASEHVISSKHLQEDRRYWVSLPLGYSDTSAYPVIYVFDAEWRFDLVRHIAFDWGAHGKISSSIIIGVPHIDWKEKRGVDLTFSHSRIEYDGETVDSTWYNTSNSGGGMAFYHYLTQELMPEVNTHYATNGHETLIGHSYGGYFGGYLLSLDHPFEVMHLYDPSIWFSDGEVTQRLANTSSPKATKIHLTYQPLPAFHKQKIEAFIAAIKQHPHLTLTTGYYAEETHNSLFLDSFYQGVLETNR